MRTSKIIIFFLLLACSKLQAQNAFVKDSLDGYIKRAMKQWQVPGLAIAIVKDGKVVVSKGYGVREVGKTDAVDENTLFQVASNTKAFTGTSLALLDYQKKLSLDDKVKKWMPSFTLQNKLAAEEATIRDMLCHRIGFQTFQGDFLNWDSNLSRADIINKMAANEPKYSFRSQFGYCNSAFLTAGEIIPLATDTTWDDYIKHHFFKPLKMTRSSTNYAAIIDDKNACKPYTLWEGKVTPLVYANTDNLGPAASINSSVKDLSNWLIMQLDSGKFEGKQVIPFQVLQKTRSSNTIVGDVNSSLFSKKHFSTYGLGWFLSDYNGRKVIEHDGGANGFVTTTCIVPEEGLGIVVLTNSDANSLYRALRVQVIDAYLNLSYKNYSDIFWRNEERQIKTLTEEIAKNRKVVAKKNAPSLPITQYAGRFKNEVYGTIEIKAEKQELTVYFSHHPRIKGKLEYMEDNKFLCTYSDPTYGIHVFPFKVENNQVKSVTVKVNDFIDYLSYEFISQE